MNTIQEIGLQNQQDFWAMLYMYMGKRIMDICGRRGEKAIRLGLRNMAVEKGRRLRADYLSKGVKTNLETLYAAGNNCSDDPRVRMEVLRQDEDIRIWEIYTCPMASLWLDQGQGWLGNLYCEENQHGLIQGFTGGKGQMNLTKKLTCHRTNGCRADNYCRFSSYYRAANTDEEQRRESFTASDEEYQPLFPWNALAAKKKSAAGVLRQWYIWQKLQWKFAAGGPAGGFPGPERPGGTGCPADEAFCGSHPQQ